MGPRAKTVTALRPARGDCVAVELDGAAWRTLPLDVAARAGLSLGLELDRPRLRVLRRELRRGEALAAAARMLRSRDLSASVLAARLARARIPAATVRDVVATLTRLGVVDDERLALARARSLAERGFGDAAIRWRLENEGLTAADIERSIAALALESERARAVVERRGASAATMRFLARRGFAEESLEAAAGVPW